jgi:hypothetical protein
MKRRVQAYRGMFRKCCYLLIVFCLPSAMAFCQLPASNLGPTTLSANVSASVALNDPASPQRASMSPAGATAYRATGRANLTSEHRGLSSSYEPRGTEVSPVQLKSQLSTSRSCNRTAPLSRPALTTRFGLSQSYANTVSSGFLPDSIPRRSTLASPTVHTTGAGASSPLLSAVLRESRGIGPHSPSTFGPKGIGRSQDPRRAAIKSLLGMNSVQKRP